MKPCKILPRREEYFVNYRPSQYTRVKFCTHLIHHNLKKYRQYPREIFRLKTHLTSVKNCNQINFTRSSHDLRTKSMFSLCAILSVTKHLMPVMQRNRNKHWSKALNYFLIIHWRKPKTELLWVISPCGIGSWSKQITGKHSVLPKF